MRNNIYGNHTNTLVDITKTFRDQLVEYKQTEPCTEIEKALGYCAMTVISTKYKNY